MRLKLLAMLIVAMVSPRSVMAAKPNPAPCLSPHLQQTFDFAPPDTRSYSRSGRCIRWFNNPTWSAQSWTVAAWDDMGPISLLLEVTNGNEDAEYEYYLVGSETRKRLAPPQVFSFQVATNDPLVRKALNLIWRALERNTYYENEEGWADSNTLYLEAFDSKGLQRAFQIYAPKYPYCASDIDDVTGFVDAYVRTTYREKFIALYEYWFLTCNPEATSEEIKRWRAMFEELPSSEKMLQRLAAAVSTMKRNEGSIFNYTPQKREEKASKQAVHPPGEKEIRSCPAYYCAEIPKKAS
jgi:hypothetical protein